jgi:LytS/YehU family sensor histidine kinase
MTTWSLLYFGIKFWLDWSKERDRAEKADLLAQSAQLQMLRYQVNPHFLFNSFSSLRALIRSDQLKAEEMLSKLSEFYRYTLATKNNSEVPLIEEIEAIEHYFEIEKIRFGKNIEVEIHIEPIAEEYPIPCFLLHPLVENSIKYGMKTSDLPIKIKIEADVIEGYLQICVANTGKWFSHPKDTNIQGTKTGIMNIKSRLGYSYPKNHEIATKEENGWVIVTVKFYKDFKNEKQV